MSKVLGDNPFEPPQASPADATLKVEPEPAPAPAATDSSAVTLDAAPDTVPPDEAIDDVFYGEEAAPTPGDYGPGLDTRKEIPYTRQSITEEVRELERRVRARLTPAVPIERRRKLPLEAFWRRYRDLARGGPGGLRVERVVAQHLGHALLLLRRFVRGG